MVEKTERLAPSCLFILKPDLTTPLCSIHPHNIKTLYMHACAHQCCCKETRGRPTTFKTNFATATATSLFM